jgi:hypothetical protein
MNKRYVLKSLSAVLLVLTMSNTVRADDVQMVAVDLRSTQENVWQVSVTLKHGDTGWDHYADDWRLVDIEGNVLGDRILRHPHVNEQPFTRSLDGVSVPVGVTPVYVEAHDKLHGWTPNRLMVDLTKAEDGHLRVERY